MMARFEGASSSRGFSTTPTTSDRVSDIGRGSTIPRLDTASSGTSFTAITLLPRSSKISIMRPMVGVSLQIRSSGKKTAKGSSPTESRAVRTAWPNPRACFWYTHETSAISEISTIWRRRRSLPRFSRAASSAATRPKYWPVASWPAEMTTTIRSIPAWAASATRVVDGRRIQNREHDLGHRPGRGKETSAEAGGGNDRLAHSH